MSHVLHINDNNLLLHPATSVDAQSVRRSQGYAWLKGDQVLFDINSEDKPISHCRISPQEINNRYWQQCAQTAIASNQAGMRHAADLIWKHLDTLKSTHDLQELALVVPGDYQDAHLQLLLGVAKACGLTINALINKPVLAASQYDLPQGEVMHIDLQLHQTVVSRLEATDSQIRLMDVNVLSDVSIQSLQESLLKGLQASFIRSDRFDPLHDAAAEQQLFDQLPLIVAAALNDDKAPVNVQMAGNLYSTIIERREIEQALTELTAMLQKHSSPLVVDSNGAFELSRFLNTGTNTVHWVSGLPSIAKATLFQGASDAGLAYQTHLPLRSRATRDSAAGVSAVAASTQSNQEHVTSSLAATHLMQNGLAIAIENASISTDNAQLTLKNGGQSSDVASMLLQGELEIVNDRQRRQLHANDRIMSPIADGVITALRVV